MLQVCKHKNSNCMKKSPTVQFIFVLTEPHYRIIWLNSRPICKKSQIWIPSTIVMYKIQL